MTELKIVGYKEFDLADLMLVGEGKYHLNPFKAEKPTEKGEEVKSNKVYLGFEAEMRARKAVAIATGISVGRARHIRLDFGTGSILLSKETAFDSTTDLVKGMSLCCKAEVGQSKYCKKCMKPLTADQIGKMVVISKGKTQPIPKEYLDSIREIRKKVYMVFPDKEGLCLTELNFPELLRKHNVDTNGYAITEGERKVIGESMAYNAVSKIEFKDDYLAQLSEFMENPKIVEEKPLVQIVEQDFSMEDLFAKPIQVRTK